MALAILMLLTLAAGGLSACTKPDDTPEHTHVWGAWAHDASSNPPTHTRKCTDTAHSETENCTFGSGVVTAPTYEADGYTTYTCTVCNYSYTSDSVPALVPENPWFLPNDVGAQFNEDFTIMYPFGTAFGASVVLNKEMADSITGPYKFSFTLDATNFEAGVETWISILGSWNEETGNCLRTGLHIHSGNSRKAFNSVSAYTALAKKGISVLQMSYTPMRIPNIFRISAWLPSMWSS